MLRIQSPEIESVIYLLSGFLCRGRETLSPQPLLGDRHFLPPRGVGLGVGKRSWVLRG